MAPCIVDSNPKLGIEKKASALNLAKIRKAIPEEAFEKSFFKSSLYMLFDFCAWGCSMYTMSLLKNSSVWSELPFLMQIAASLLYWNIAGFFMWCVFMIGHDCGHTNFCNSEIVNDIVGHVAHGSILVPYHPWQLSHRRHHMYHNHVDKDYSHPWYTPERLQRPDEGLARMMHSDSKSWLRSLFPFYGWHIYLYGMPDGSHYFPFTSQRMWRGSDLKDRMKCILSTGVVALYTALFYTFFGDMSTFAFYYLGPYVFFGWWLVTVTYLQHHDHDTIVYGDHDWKFVESAFETVDRRFGFGIDSLHHHITDGHVAHHLFFTKIPHYNLPIATKAIKKYMEDNDLAHMYKNYDTHDFVFRVHQYFIDFGFKATRAPPHGRLLAPDASAAAESTSAKVGEKSKDL